MSPIGLVNILQLALGMTRSYLGQRVLTASWFSSLLLFKFSDSEPKSQVQVQVTCHGLENIAVSPSSIRSESSLVTREEEKRVYCFLSLSADDAARPGAGPGASVDLAPAEWQTKMVSLISSLCQCPMGAGFLPSLRSSRAFMPFGMDLFNFRTMYHSWNYIMIQCIQDLMLSNLWRPNVHSRETLATTNLNYRYM